jgi:ATP-dependent helicase HrpA
VVAIFPGSSLFKASPRWIMAAEIVQTTRLYARTVAKIDPAWVEELAGHMFKRQVSDPHLDAATGRPVAFERVSMSGVVVVPRREVELASVDPATARRVFVLEALARGRWTGAEADDGDNRPTIAALEHNAAVLALVRKAEERVRRRGLVRSDEQLAAWLNARLPETVRDPASLRQWLARDPAGDAHLRWSIDDVIAPTAAPDVRRGLDAAMFPDTLAIGAASMPLSYALAPGKDDDGVSVDVPLAEADRLTTERAAWLVPGLLADLIAAMLKGLSKEQRAALERAAGVRIEDAASGVASVLNFAEGSLPGAISEALSVLYGASVGPEALEKALKGVPDHLRVRVRVLDERGGVAGAGRDIGAVLARLGPRIAAARASVARRAFAQSGLKAWTFGNLPERVEADQGGPGAPESAGGWPAIVDHGTSAGLTLAPSPEHARAWTLRGVRRLYVLACGEELSCLIDALPGLSEMARQYQALGHSAAPGGLKDALACVVAERIFLAGHAEPPRTRDEFEARLEAGRGRLTVASREVGEVAARVLDARGKVAHRLASGTPRLWAASIADIREHATYLLAEGWLTSVGWERLRRYPVYAEAMRERLANLREEGSKAELTALAQFAPHWKRYTAWVAAAMSRERERHADGADAGQEPSGPGSAAGKKKAALPQTRRTGAVVNIDAGAWVMAGGAGGGRGGKGLPPAVEAYRWALEELRVSLFAPGLSGAGKTSVPEVERLWRAVGAAD